MDLIDNNVDAAAWASLMQPEKETARKAFERKLTAAYDHKATMEWLLKQEEAEKASTPPTRLEYEWTRVKARKRYLAFKNFKEKYQKETVERDRRASALKRMVQFQTVQGTIPTKLFKHTALEKTIYGVVYAYYSITSLLALVFLLTIDRAMSVLDRFGLTFEPAADVCDVQYAEWQQKNKALVLEGKTLQLIDHEFYNDKGASVGVFNIGGFNAGSSTLEAQPRPTKNIKTELDKVIAQEAVVAKAKLQQVAKKVVAKE